jgi:hypothetical protein
MEEVREEKRGNRIREMNERTYETIKEMKPMNDPFADPFLLVES